MQWPIGCIRLKNLGYGFMITVTNIRTFQFGVVGAVRVVSVVAVASVVSVVSV